MQQIEPNIHTFEDAIEHIANYGRPGALYFIEFPESFVLHGGSVRHPVTISLTFAEHGRKMFGHYSVNEDYRLTIRDANYLTKYALDDAQEHASVKKAMLDFCRKRKLTVRVIPTMFTGEYVESKDRMEFLRAERTRLHQALARLADAIERGAGGDLMERYLARQNELASVQVELAALNVECAAGRVRVTDSALRVVASEIGAALHEFAAEGLAELRALVAATIKKAELKGNQLALLYSPLPFLRTLETSFAAGQHLGAVSAPNGIPTFPTFPQVPQNNTTIPAFLLETASIHITRPPRSRYAHAQGGTA